MGGLGDLRRVSFIFLPYISRGLMHLVYSWDGLAWLWQTGSLGARKLWFCSLWQGSVGWSGFGVNAYYISAPHGRTGIGLTSWRSSFLLPSSRLYYSLYIIDCGLQL